MDLGESFDAELIQPDSGKGAWTFVRVPEELAPRASKAWGMVPVMATVNGREWSTSIWWDKTWGPLLPVPKKIRKKDLKVGDVVVVRVVAR